MGTLLGTVEMVLVSRRSSASRKHLHAARPAQFLFFIGQLVLHPNQVASGFLQSLADFHHIGLRARQQIDQHLRALLVQSFLQLLVLVDRHAGPVAVERRETALLQVRWLLNHPCRVGWGGGVVVVVGLRSYRELPFQIHQGQRRLAINLGETRFTRQFLVGRHIEGVAVRGTETRHELAQMPTAAALGLGQDLHPQLRRGLPEKGEIGRNVIDLGHTEIGDGGRNLVVPENLGVFVVRARRLQGEIRLPKLFGLPAQPPVLEIPGEIMQGRRGFGRNLELAVRVVHVVQKEFKGCCGQRVQLDPAGAICGFGKGVLSQKQATKVLALAGTHREDALVDVEVGCGCSTARNNLDRPIAQAFGGIQSPVQTFVGGGRRLHVGIVIEHRPMHRLLFV